MEDEEDEGDEDDEEDEKDEEGYEGAKGEEGEGGEEKERSLLRWHFACGDIFPVYLSQENWRSWTYSFV